MCLCGVTSRYHICADEMEERYEQKHRKTVHFEEVDAPQATVTA
jgi:hypothetical protein